MVIITLHSTNKEKLEGIISEMKILGSPSLRGVFSPALDCWVALEGVHRLNAAQALGLPVDMLEVDYNDNIDTDCDCSVADIVDDAAARYNCGMYVKVEII